MNNRGFIKSFSIRGLFGTTDVKIPFDSKVKILIGENGIGKTQVLNMLYYTLNKNFERLIEFSFKELEIKFIDNEKVVISRKELEQLFEHPDVQRLITRIGWDKFLEMRNSVSNLKSPNLELRRNPIFRKMLDDFPTSQSMILRAFDSFFENGQSNIFNASLNRKGETIDNYFKDYQILYFPTYRRVEEDLRNLGYDEDKFGVNKEDSRLIHFGMDDVSKIFNEITKKIERLSKDGFSKISSEILSQLVKGLPSIDNNLLKSIDEVDIEIILARVGDQISSDDKKRIKEIVAQKDEIQDKDHSLLYFLQKLIETYEPQRELDDSIKLFRDICNKYLVNKKLIYDESKIEIFIQANGSEDKLQLSKLSSGEKQILSTFSKVYLASPDCKFLVLFDEPELSLSIDWQKKLLPDIYNSGKCDFLFAVTHSPFIFENELDENAIGLNEYLNIKLLQHPFA